MKNSKLLLGLLFLFAFSLQNCTKDKCSREVTYMKYTAITKTAEEITTDIKSVAPRELVNPGKIYFYNNYIFINERNEGIHVIDNTNPENPQNISFINMPGNADISIKNNVLLGDSYFFLVSLDIADPTNIRLLGQTETWNNYYSVDATGNYVVGYTEEEVTEEIDCAQQNIYYDRNGSFAPDLANAEVSPFGSFSSGSSQAPSVGVGGSMARFTIYDKYLYAVDWGNLRVYDISDTQNPSLQNTINIGFGIETIFPYGDKLFIGSTNGMFIFDNADPLNPVLLSNFQHARACDPVFVKDNFAYVTLRSGNACDGFNNQLDLVDVTDLTNPVLVKTFQLQNPHGLSIKGNNLFVCEGDFGLKTFDIEDPATLNERLLSHLEDFATYDVISVPGNANVLLVIGDDGFYQFDFDNPSDLKQLSHIPVKR